MLGAWGTPLSFLLFSYFLIWLLRAQTTVMQQQTWQHRLLPELIWEGPRILADSYKLSRCKLLHGRRWLQVAVEIARIACGARKRLRTKKQSMRKGRAECGLWCSRAIFVTPQIEVRRANLG
jgi:hypothetical protein